MNFPSRVNSSNELYTALTKDFSLPSLGANEKLQSGNEKDPGLLSDAKEQVKEPRSIDVLQQEQTEKIARNDFGEELAASNESEPLRETERSGQHDENPSSDLQIGNVAQSLSAASLKMEANEETSRDSEIREFLGSCGGDLLDFFDIIVSNRSTHSEYFLSLVFFTTCLS